MKLEDQDKIAIALGLLGGLGAGLTTNIIQQDAPYFGAPLRNVGVRITNRIATFLADRIEIQQKEDFNWSEYDRAWEELQNG